VTPVPVAVPVAWDDPDVQRLAAAQQVKRIYVVPAARGRGVSQAVDPDAADSLFFKRVLDPA
jgi:hypothetical protein